MMALPVLGFYMMAFGQRSYPSAPDIGFWATVFALLLTLGGLARALYISRVSIAHSLPPSLPEAQKEQRAAVLSAPGSMPPAQDTSSQDG